MITAAWRVIEFLLPATCLLCEHDLPSGYRRPICAGCVRTLNARPRTFLRPSRSVTSLVTCGSFEQKLRDLIHLYKYHGKDYLADHMLDLLSWDVPEVDAVTWVPTSWRADLKRGFNPAELLGRELTKRLKVPWFSGTIRRRLWGTSQTQLTRGDRLKNALRNYEGRRRAPAPPPRVLLVDDVYTTGATMERCAALLKSRGAKEVHGFCLAKDELKE